MDRSRRGAQVVERPAKTSEAEGAPPQVPASSRLTMRARKNRRRPVSLWSRVPRPRTIADACGRALRRSVPAAVASGALVLALGAIWLGYRFVTSSPRFAVTSIAIQGAGKLTDDDVRAALPIKVGDNVFTADLDDALTALRAHPWIAAASAHRILPDTLVVEIRERTATAIAMLGGPYLVDQDGHPFKRLAAGEGEGLPVVTGVSRAAYHGDPLTAAAAIKAALAAHARWREVASRPAIAEVQIDALGALVLRTQDGVAIELGTLTDRRGGELAPRLHTFDTVWAELSERERTSARTIHLDTRSDRITVAFAKDGK